MKDLEADWLDEAAEAALAGNPRRAHYLEYMATQVPRIVETAALRAVAERRTWPPPTNEAVEDARRRLARMAR